jgi:hypothetical protein
MKKLIIVLAVVLVSSSAYALTLSGANLPFDSNLHLGLVNGPGTGLDVGANMLVPMTDLFSWGGEFEVDVTNSEFDQNINIEKYGFAFQYIYSDALNFIFHLGKSSFYLSKPVTYIDSFSGSQLTIGDANQEDTHGSGSYYGLSVNIKVGDFFASPTFIVNSITGGGNIFEVDLNLSRQF